MGNFRRCICRRNFLLSFFFGLLLDSFIGQVSCVSSTSPVLKEKPRKPQINHVRVHVTKSVRSSDRDLSSNSVDNENDLLPSDSIASSAAAAAGSSPAASAVVPVPDSVAVEAGLPPPVASVKGDLKGADTFGLGYYNYLPIVTHALVNYHPYPVLYYHPTTYLRSIRHHGYGGIGFYHHAQHQAHPHHHLGHIHGLRHHHHHNLHAHHHGTVHGVLH